MKDYDKELREAAEVAYLELVDTFSAPATWEENVDRLRAALDNVKGKPTAVSLVGKICVFDGQKHSDGHLEYENGWADAVLEFRKRTLLGGEERMKEKPTWLEWTWENHWKTLMPSRGVYSMVAIRGRIVFSVSWGPGDMSIANVIWHLRLVVLGYGFRLLRRMSGSEMFRRSGAHRQ